MPSFEQSLRQVPRIENVDQPLVLYKVGMLGAAPLEFMPALADAYGMSYASSDKIRHAMIVERDTQGMARDRAQDINTRQVQAVLRKEVDGCLRADDDIALDMFANAPRSRQLLYDTVQRGGGLAIGLVFNTPVSQALGRVESWMEADEFEIPTDRWTYSPMSVAGDMSRQLRKPVGEEAKNGLFFNLDGSGTAQDLLEQTEAYFHATGLMARFEDA